MSNKDKQLIENFLNSLYGDNCSKHTISNYKIDLNFFIEYLKIKNLTVTDATLEVLEGYKAHLRDVTYGNGKHYSENTRARRISSLKSFYEFLFDRDIIASNPAHKLKIPKKEKGAVPVFMTQKEARKLIDATVGARNELRDKTIITLFLTTGMRLSELAGLNITDIVGSEVTISKGKGNKTRTVNISKNVSDLVKEYLKNRKYEDGDAVFVSEQNKRMSDRTIQSVIEKCIKKAKLDKRLTTHSLRHSFASMLVKNKVDLNTVRELLGHSSLTTTQIYTHVLDEDKREAANIVGEIFK